MTEENPNLSDWIQFLISQKNHAYVFIFGIISAIIGLMIISLTFLQFYGFVEFIPMMLIVTVLVIVLIIIVYGQDSTLNRPKLLLEKIMKREITNVREIEYKWFERGGNMQHRNYYNSGFKGFAILGFAFILIGLVFAGIAFYQSFSGDFNLEIQFGFGFFSSGAGLIAIGIALHSVDIGKGSDKKMDKISNLKFLEVYGNLQDWTLYNINRLSDVRERKLLILKWRNGLLQLVRLKEYANQNERDNAVFPFISFIENLPWSNNVIMNHEITGWIIPIYQDIRRLNPTQLHLDKLMKLFKEYIAYNLNEIDFNDLLAQAQEILQTMDKDEIFQRFIIE